MNTATTTSATSGEASRTDAPRSGRGGALSRTSAAVSSSPGSTSAAIGASSRRSTPAASQRTPASTAYAASRYSDRNQNGSARAFHSRAGGAVTNTIAAPVAIADRNSPTRSRRASAIPTAMAASTVTGNRCHVCTWGNSPAAHDAFALHGERNGKRFAENWRIFSQPMSFEYGSRRQNGSTQNDASSSATGSDVSA